MAASDLTRMHGSHAWIEPGGPDAAVGRKAHGVWWDGTHVMAVERWSSAQPMVQAVVADTSCRREHLGDLGFCRADVVLGLALAVAWQFGAGRFPVALWQHLDHNGVPVESPVHGHLALDQHVLRPAQRVSVLCPAGLCWHWVPERPCGGRHHSLQYYTLPCSLPYK